MKFVNYVRVYKLEKCQLQQLFICNIYFIANITTDKWYTDAMEC